MLPRGTSGHHKLGNDTMCGLNDHSKAVNKISHTSLTCRASYSSRSTATNILPRVPTSLPEVAALHVSSASPSATTQSNTHVLGKQREAKAILRLLVEVPRSARVCARLHQNERALGSKRRRAGKEHERVRRCTARSQWRLFMTAELRCSSTEWCVRLSRLCCDPSDTRPVTQVTDAAVLSTKIQLRHRASSMSHRQGHARGTRLQFFPQALWRWTACLQTPSPAANSEEELGLAL